LLTLGTSFKLNLMLWKPMMRRCNNVQRLIVHEDDSNVDL